MLGSAYVAAIVTASVIALPVLSSMCGGGEPADPWGVSGLGSYRDEEAGHYGPAWGYVGGEPVIVFRWDGGLYGRDGSIYAIREDGTGLTLISPSVGDRRALSRDRAAYDTSPAISPNGTQVAYATLRLSERVGYFDIVTAQLDGKPGLLFLRGGRERQQLTEGEVSQSEPAWSPDGARIAFLQDGDLHTMAADGSDVRGIAPGILAAYKPAAWSPDGTRLAFRGGLDGVLYVVGEDGSNLRQVAERTDGWEARSGRLAWSPDGRRIAFMRASEEALGNTDLYVVDVEGNGRAARIAWGFGSPVWSPDSTEIFFGHADAYVEGQGLPTPGLYAIAVDDPHHARRVTEFGMNSILGMAWSLDGTRLAVLITPLSYYTGRSGSEYADVLLYTVDADGANLRVLLREGLDGELVAEAGSTLRETDTNGDENSPWDGLSSPSAVFTVVAAVALVPITAYALWLRSRVQREGRRRQN